MAAMDVMLFDDRVPGVLNLVSFEKLARRALGVYKAWEKVESEADWSRPQGAKNWRSKVDYEQQKRIDPSTMDDATMKMRSLEDEVRKEMERDASILKARSKLAAHTTTEGQ